MSLPDTLRHLADLMEAHPAVELPGYLLAALSEAIKRSVGLLTK